MPAGLWTIGTHGSVTTAYVCRTADQLALRLRGPDSMGRAATRLVVPDLFAPLPKFTRQRNHQHDRAS